MDSARLRQTSVLGMADDDEEDGVDDVRQEVLESLMRQWEPRYSKYRNVSVFAGTFNINGQLPCPSLAPWLAHPVSTPPDIYAIGFQELDLSQSAFFNGYSTREEDWARLCHHSLHPDAEYAEVQRSRLVGMLLLVYAKVELVKEKSSGLLRKKKSTIDLRKVDEKTVGTGILNRGGNKGGVALSFSVADTTVLFVCSHLAAGSDELARRNQDFREITKLDFGNHRRNFFDHDAIFWLGDLNYRFADLNADMVKYACEKEEWERLAGKDQLKQEQEGKRAFEGFREGPIFFRPTYKYDPGTHRWDSSEKGLVQVEQKAYSSVPAITISDHKPVYAVFDLKVKEIDEKERENTFKEALKESDRQQNDALPQVELSTPTLPNSTFMLNPVLDFGPVHFLEPRSQVLTVRNVGKLAVVYKFRRKPGDTNVFQPWLEVTPLSQRISPTKESHIHILVAVDKETVWKMNKTGETAMEDMLVLHLRNGRDFFISVKAEYMFSCFGLSLEKAWTRSPKPETPADVLIDLVTFCRRGAPKPPLIADRDRQIGAAYEAGVPFPLWRLVNHIQTYGLQSAELFSQASSQKDFGRIREALDSDAEESGDGTVWGKLPGSIHSVVEALLRMLDSLPEPVIPKASTDACLRMVSPGLSPHHCWAPIKNLPSVHRNSFVFLVSFLRLVHANAEHNSTDIDLIGSVFAAVVLGLDAASSEGGSKGQSKERREAANRFLAAAIAVPTPPDLRPLLPPSN